MQPPTVAPQTLPATLGSLDKVEDAQSSTQAAAVMLGLVSQHKPTSSAQPGMAVGIIPPQYASAPAPSFPVVSLPPATMQSAHSVSAQHQGQLRAVPHYQAQGVTAVPLPTLTMAGQPQSQANLVPTIQQRLPPPPPLAPAPTVVLSPKGGPPTMPAPMASASAMPFSDIKVLLDLAKSSGNQQAVDALRRQAQQLGMSSEQFDSMLVT